jgi:hypothetical protein
MENWKAVPGFEGLYEVSDQGNVRSLDRIIQKKVRGKIVRSRHRGRVLFPGLDTSGYFMVNLHAEQTRKCALVSRLVLSAFDRLPKSGEECRHLDGVRTNNVRSNLAWGTASDNTADKIRHGTVRAPRGEEHGLSKLTTQDVLRIRSKLGEQSAVSLARDFAVSQQCIEKIAQRKTWAWLP